MPTPLDYAKPERDALGATIAALHAAALGYPAVLVGVIYGSWLGAWAALGHQPRPRLDDPSQVLGVAYFAAVPVVALLPGAMIAVAWSVHFRCRSTAGRPWRAWGWVLLVGAAWAGAIWLLRADPFGVVDWWMD